jgi:hypothetical protein
MTATPSIELPSWMAEQLSQASPDLLRQMVQIFAEALVGRSRRGLRRQLRPRLRAPCGPGNGFASY